MPTNDIFLCRNPKDSYFDMALYTHRESRWHAILSNGEDIYQDDYREEGIEKAWFRLQKYCNANSLQVMCIHLEFWQNIIENVVPPSCVGYFFRKGAAGFLFGDSTKFFLFGNITRCNQQNTKVYVDTYKYIVPENLLFETEIDREIDITDAGILWNIQPTLSNLNILKTPLDRHNILPNSCVNV